MNHTHPVLVTGGTGFVGSHVVERLLSDGHAVRCLIRRDRKTLAWLTDLPVEIVRGDLSPTEDLSGALEGVRTVIHIAGVTKARRAEDYKAGNVETTRTLLDAALRHNAERFVLISSQTAMGPSPQAQSLDESSPCLPITSYGSSKLAAENLCRSYADAIDLTILRPSAVYGPRDRDILEMFRWVSYGLRPIIGSRNKTISLIHVTDLARMIAKASFDKRTTGKTYCLTDPTPYQFSDLIKGISRVVGKRTFPLFLPSALIYGAAAVVEIVAPLFGRQAVLTIEKARDILQPAWVCSSRAFENDMDIASEIPIERGLKQTYDWYTSKGWL